MHANTIELIGIQHVSKGESNVKLKDSYKSVFLEIIALHIIGTAMAPSTRVTFTTITRTVRACVSSS